MQFPFNFKCKDSLLFGWDQGLYSRFIVCCYYFLMLTFSLIAVGWLMRLLSKSKNNLFSTSSLLRCCSLLPPLDCLKKLDIINLFRIPHSHSSSLSRWSSCQSEASVFKGLIENSKKKSWRVVRNYGLEMKDISWRNITLSDTYYCKLINSSYYRIVVKYQTKAIMIYVTERVLNIFFFTLITL